jgi:hypothetical protein
MIIDRVPAPLPSNEDDQCRLRRARGTKLQTPIVPSRISRHRCPQSAHCAAPRSHLMYLPKTSPTAANETISGPGTQSTTHQKNGWTLMILSLTDLVMMRGLPSSLLSPEGRDGSDACVDEEDSIERVLCDGNKI